MRKIYFWAIGIAVVGALAYGIAAKIHNPSKKKSRRSRPRAKSGIAIPVEIAPVVIKDIRNVNSFTGTLEPWSRYEVAPKIAGRLESINVSAGIRYITDNLSLKLMMQNIYRKSKRQKPISIFQRR